MRMDAPKSLFYGIAALILVAFGFIVLRRTANLSPFLAPTSAVIGLLSLGTQLMTKVVEKS